MTRLPAAALALLLAAPPALADPPRLAIPAEVRPAGQYVNYLPDTDAVSVTYVGLSGVEPIPPDLLKDARRFVLDTRGLAAGRYLFVAVAAGATGEQARGLFAVPVGDAPPGPDPPQPPTPPAPTPDPLGLVKASRDGAANVDPAVRLAGAKPLADANRAHASAVAAGAFPSPGAILNGWREANKRAADPVKWANWGNAVSAALQTTYNAGKLKTNQEWAVAFSAIADGLEGK